MEKIKPPPELDMDSRNLAEAWREFEESWELYEISSGLTTKEEKVQVATLYSIVGLKARRVLKTLPGIPEAIAERKVKDTLKALKDYCMPRTNITYERYIFRTTTQGERQFDTFLTELRRKAALCDFGVIKDSLIRDQIVIGTNSPTLRERLLREPDLTLMTAINLCRASEQAIEQSKLITRPEQSQEIKEIDSLNARAPTQNQNKGQSFKCRFCGLQHDRGNCTAYNATCHRCKEKNHFARCCTRKLPQPQAHQQQRGASRAIREVELQEQQDPNNLYKEIESLYIEEIKSSNKIKCVEQCLSLNGKNVTFKLDSGAECNVIPEAVAKELDCTIEQTALKLRAFGGNPLKTVGKCYIDTIVQGQESPIAVEYYIVEHNVRPILGVETCLTLGLITFSGGARAQGLSIDALEQPRNLLDQFEDVFTGLGCVEGEYDICLKEGARPTIQHQRNVPLRLIEQLKTTINDLEQREVIKKVNEPVEWVSNLVIVEKKDKSLRLCLDPPDLNEAIVREDYKPPSIEKISSTLNGCTVFTVVDMSSCYWHKKLSDAASLLCTFNAPFGRIRFCRMPFGISCASEVAQKMVEEHFGDIGVLPVYDDIIIAGKTTAEHDRALHKVLERARERNIRFNKSKIQYRLDKVSYMGEVVSNNGFTPDPAKVSAILKMPVPQCKKDLQRLLGMINYLSKYIPSMAELTAPLRMLLRKEAAWAWHPEHDAALAKLKTALTSKPVLRFYDIHLPTTLQVDASKSGLGACLLQNGQPVAYASRALTSAEQNYAQIEKELLAIVFGCERFNMYTYGADIDVD
ncbi:uncharacterized protein K02A2.6-like isoform X1 [Nematostella vectensis]|uniref:uncharacterized protein K02A2.6-like isoform X1 n=1 Tax=Nematostella vectensis TaxID=45351 RepID=UPI0020772EEA|nr:uncharacterized protein K02A2.6-like isoform X1 [Nematostella vectensis]XP_048581052.1 uncharacterized protein K02A2.6-like isoform X1 [Nematostella vectensis]XP_048581103.1 uncharacterized protein K02A2.6-like isoform X1 [Nematostella vectensis]XP_048581121.1 uncharacterized protein K02A2.6-like isoform X1 [Nematostella vectensis]